MSSLLFTYVVTACAMITASAAVAGAGYLRSMKNSVDENEKRSKANKRLLTGKGAPHYEGVIHKLKRLESRGDES
ncbi:hypothetical protein [Haloarchaeobius sp. TZWSO28]|uniref:hypothetical protein n=1 Tax=Haloarchaeobius sp. TZWSO28 TaxID=3446119 RepID=UPI003EBD4A33